MRSLLVAVGLFLVGFASSTQAQFCPAAPPYVFDDVLANDPLCPAITWMALNKITSGCRTLGPADLDYCPNDGVTRKQMAKFMYQLGAIRVQEVDTGPGLTGGPITATGTIALAATNLLPTVACAVDQIPRWNGNAWTCMDASGTGTVTNLSAGSGVTLTPNPIVGAGAIAADTTYLQRRVNGSCAPGSSIRTINADGSVLCEADDGAAGNAFVQGGNAFGAPAVLGTTDNRELSLIANGQTALRLRPTVAAPVIGYNTPTPSLVGGWSLNLLTSGVIGAAIGGGGGNYLGIDRQNWVSDHYGTIAGGIGNLAGNGPDEAPLAPDPTDRPFATVGGGYRNAATGHASTVGGGENNAASAQHATVGGGLGNGSTDIYATVGGGNANFAGRYGVVVGGSNNLAEGEHTTIGGGSDNQTFDFLGNLRYATISGGWTNLAYGDYSTVVGGHHNSASNVASTVAGGAFNAAFGEYSFAAGINTYVPHARSFVWGGDPGNTTQSQGIGTFVVYAPGGVHLYAGPVGAGGCILSSGAGWSCVPSVRASKTTIVRIDPIAVLDRMAALPIMEWSYTVTPEVRHMGPMAEDFHAAFGLGDNPAGLTYADVQGVALAAIQGLNAKLEERIAEKDHQIAGQQREIAELRQRVVQVESLREELAALRAAIAGVTRGATVVAQDRAP